MEKIDPTETAPPSECERCGKPLSLCVCKDITPINNKIALLILQHPQEQDRELGTARLTTLHLKNAILRVGLSWPSLEKAVGQPVDPKRWAILYLGAASAATLPKDRELVLLDSKAKPLDDQDRTLAGIQGIVVIDGTWSQAKTLWWRNAWVLKCRRLALNPKQRSRYGALRREPRREGLATLEAAALVLTRLGRQPEIETALSESFRRLLELYRASTRSK